jgi:hypothetical protein
MIFTSKYTNLTAPTFGRVKSGFLAPGEAAQKKLYTAEHVPSATREWGLIFTLLPLPHAGAEIPTNCREMPHSAAVGGGITVPQGPPPMAHRALTWANSTCSTRSPNGTQTHNLLNPYRKVYYGPKIGVNLNGDLFQGSASNLPGRTCHHE